MISDLCLSVDFRGRGQGQEEEVGGSGVHHVSASDRRPPLHRHGGDGEIRAPPGGPQ